jgi:hypothetical protein
MPASRSYVATDKLKVSAPNQDITIWMKLHLVHLGHNSVKNLSFERSEHDGLILHRIHNKSLARLYESSSNVVNGSYSYYKAVPITTFLYTVFIYIGHKSQQYLYRIKATLPTQNS